MSNVRSIKVQVASAVGVADRWREQYHRADGWGDTVSGSTKAVHEKLLALGESPPIESVAAVIGNKSWSYLTCSGCGESVEMAVAIGPDWRDDLLLICRSCAGGALTALERAMKP